MQKVNIHGAKTHLSRLLENVASGEALIIAKAGKPMVTVSPYHEESAKPQMFGFSWGKFKAPDDIKTVGQNEIAAIIIAGDRFSCGAGGPSPSHSPGSL